MSCKSCKKRAKGEFEISTDCRACNDALMATASYNTPEDLAMLFASKYNRGRTDSPRYVQCRGGYGYVIGRYFLGRINGRIRVADMNQNQDELQITTTEIPR